MGTIQAKESFQSPAENDRFGLETLPSRHRWQRSRSGAFFRLASA